MVIEDKDFKMEFDGSTGFDLYFLNSKNNFVLIGYNIPFQSCIKRITYYRVSKKLETTTMSEFLSVWTKVNKETTDLINSLNV